MTVGNAVDLGLPSGTLWADRNLGASLNTGIGWYFAWGETRKRVPTKYKFLNGVIKREWGVREDIFDGKITKYVIPDGRTDKQWYKANGDYDFYGNQTYSFTGDGKYVLDLCDDAAHVNWGGEWHIPTSEQCRELYESCKWNYTDNYYGKGIEGWQAVGPNGNSIFLPKTGIEINKNDYVNKKLVPAKHIESDFCGYWNSEIASGSVGVEIQEGENNLRAKALVLRGAYHSNYREGILAEWRHSGLPVRPICNPSQKE